DLLYDLDQDPHELNNLIDNPEYDDVARSLKSELMTRWDPEKINDYCLQSQKERLFIQKTTGGDPNWAYCARAGDRERFIRNDSAVGTKAKARYPFVEPTPFIK
ncbi:MAG: choline-sulfatase, partial [bacterium]